MKHLVKDGARALIRLVVAHADISTIRTVGSGSAGVVTYVEVDALNTRKVIPQANSLVGSLADALTGTGIATITNAIGHGAFRNGVELDDVAINSLATLGLHVGTHIILGGRRELLQPIDAAAIVQEGLCRLVVDGGLGFLGAVAEALLFNLCRGYPANGHTSKSHRRSASKALVGGYGLSPCSGADCHEHQCQK